jgi:hypothetical protein
MKKIFPTQPTVPQKDRERLLSAGYLDGWNKLVRALKVNKPNKDDLKRLVLLELESPEPRLPILEKLIVQVQRCERREINRAIKTNHPGLSKL